MLMWIKLIAHVLLLLLVRSDVDGLELVWQAQLLQGNGGLDTIRRRHAVHGDVGRRHFGC